MPIPPARPRYGPGELHDAGNRALRARRGSGSDAEHRADGRSHCSGEWRERIGDARRLRDDSAVGGADGDRARAARVVPSNTAGASEAGIDDLQYARRVTT
jgi:hypothetical protein